MTRFISFRMDDGFIVGARKAMAILAPDPISFFIVTGRVFRTVTVDHIELLRGVDFGSIDEWREVASQGHDVQAHSVTHADFGQVPLEQQIREVRESVSIIRTIHGGPYVFCYPNNTLSSMDLASLGLSAAGFVTVNSSHAVSFNTLGANLDLFRLRSWAVRERHFDSIASQLGRDVPDESWTILGFHSLDGEGREPWSSAGFSNLVNAIRALDYRIVSVGEMVDRIIGRSEK
jgi:peptidoglycan/xylan/chitin deacetylase (PgdA/CDA1 family)